MRELIESINDAAIMAKADELPDNARLYPELQEAAEKWATHSLRCYQGESLRRALAISQSLIDFVEEISKS